MTARILVVDDVPANVKLLEARLSAEYFDVATATSGSEALAKCEKAECDIVLLDVMMPDMDGFQVCEALRQNERTRGIPIILLTAKDDMETRVVGMRLGVSEFLTKPINKTELFARLRAQMHQRTIEHRIAHMLSS